MFHLDILLTGMNYQGSMNKVLRRCLKISIDDSDNSRNSLVIIWRKLTIDNHLEANTKIIQSIFWEPVARKIKYPIFEGSRD